MWAVFSPRPARADTPVFVRPGGSDTYCNGTANLDYNPTVAPVCALKSAHQALSLASPGDIITIQTSTGTISLPLPEANEISVAALPPLAISKTDSPDPVSATQPLTYTVRITNTGGLAVDQVQLVDFLPPVGVVSVKSIDPAANCVQVADLINCTLGTLNAGATTVVTIVVTPTAAGTIHNSALVRDATPPGSETISDNELN